MKRVGLELGSGGKLMRDFIAGQIVPRFANRYLGELSDASHLPDGVAFTTDSYVVDPIFFPGGDIGTLAVNGTVNDLVVSGAVPRFLSLALILEEGLAGEDLERVLDSVRTAARKAGVSVVTGDTKVVRRGQGDKIFINTSGIGRVIARPALAKIRPGDKLILTGTLGEHSTAIMLARGEYGFTSRVRSDCAPSPLPPPVLEDGRPLDEGRHPGRPGHRPIRTGRAPPLSPPPRRGPDSPVPARCAPPRGSWGSIPSSWPARAGPSSSPRKPGPTPSSGTSAAIPRGDGPPSSARSRRGSESPGNCS